MIINHMRLVLSLHSNKSVMETIEPKTNLMVGKDINLLFVPLNNATKNKAVHDVVLQRLALIMKTINHIIQLHQDARLCSER